MIHKRDGGKPSLFIQNYGTIAVVICIQIGYNNVYI